MMPSGRHEDGLSGCLQDLESIGGLQTGKFLRVEVTLANVGCEVATMPGGTRES